MSRFYRKLTGFSIAASAAFALWSAPEAVIRVDASNPAGPVKKYLFGHNIEAGDPRGIFSDTFDAKTFDTQYIRNAHGFWNPDSASPNLPVTDEAKRTGISMLRYPGGCLVANYDWRKAAGPLEKRGDWRFGLNEYVKLCRALNAEPIITCSDYVLPAEEMPRHLADMVEYLNAPATPEHPWAMKRKESGHPEPFGVRWFELGNESEAGNYYCKPRRKFTEETYGEYALKSIEAMKKADPSIKIGVQYKIGEKAYRAADFVIVHHYGGKIDGRDSEANFKSAMAHVEHFKRTLEKRSEEVDAAAGRKMPLALTEYNLFYFKDQPIPFRRSALGGLFCADLLRMLLEPECPVEVANFWNLSNGWFGVFQVRGGDVVRRYAPLAFFQLWGEHFGGLQLRTGVRNSPRVESAAAADTPPARGEHFLPEAVDRDVTPSAYDFTTLAAQGIRAESPERGRLEFTLNRLNQPCYLNFGYLPHFPEDSGKQYKLSFESRFLPDQTEPGGRLGLSLLDSRGWEKTFSAVAASNLESDRDWNAHSAVFLPRPDCPGIFLVFRAPNARNLSGKLEVRNFRIETLTPAVMPAYQALTSTASLAEDGKTLHLIVFNKSFAPIPATVELNGFEPRSARSWTVAAPPETVEYRPPTESAVALPPDGRPPRIVFPACSMTAIDFSAEKKEPSAARLEISGEMRISVSVPSEPGKTLERSFDVKTPEAIQVEAEAHEYFPVYDPSRPWYATGTSPRKSIFHQVVPGSMRVRAGTGENARLYEEGKDYRFDAGNNRIGKTPDSGIATLPVYLSYRMIPQRIDSVVRNGDTLTYREGVASGVMPRPPELNPGEIRLANLWLPSGTRKLNAANLFPVLEREFAGAAPAADELLPKTMRKLRNGEPLRILAWGDSVTEGYGAIQPADRWQEQFAEMLRKRFPQARIQLTTNGWGGHNTGDFMNAPKTDQRHHYESAVAGAGADLVISLFVNDSWHTREKFDGIYPRVLDDFRRTGTEWIVMTPHHIAGMTNRDGEDRRPYVNLLREFARKNRVALVDGSDRYSRLYRQGIPWLTLMVNHYNHPDRRGMKIYADALMELFPEK